MAASTGVFRITTADGQKQEVTVGVRQIVEMERRWPGRAADRSDWAPGLESMYYSVYLAAGGSPVRSDETETFDAWLDSVTDVEFIEAEDPTPSLPGLGAV